MSERKHLSVSVAPRTRIMRGKVIALGPGKVELLAQLEQTHSITAAARNMGMSYMRAWTLIKTMNHCFRKPLVEALRGGKTGGGARLTPMGVKALRLYRAMELNYRKSAQPIASELCRMLVPERNASPGHGKE